MSEKTSVTLGDYFAGENEMKMEALSAALLEGEQSGPSTPFDFESFIAHKRRQKISAR